MQVIQKRNVQRAGFPQTVLFRATKNILNTEKCCWITNGVEKWLWLKSTVICRLRDTAAAKPVARFPIYHYQLGDKHEVAKWVAHSSRKIDWFFTSFGGISHVVRGWLKEERYSGDRGNVLFHLSFKTKCSEISRWPPTIRFGRFGWWWYLRGYPWRNMLSFYAVQESLADWKSYKYKC